MSSWMMRFCCAHSNNLNWDPHTKPVIRKERGDISSCVFPHSCCLSSLRAKAREKRSRHNKSQWTLFAPNIHRTVWPNEVCVTWQKKDPQTLLKLPQCRNADEKRQTSFFCCLSQSCAPTSCNFAPSFLIWLPFHFPLALDRGNHIPFALIWKIISEAAWTINVIFVFISSSVSFSRHHSFFTLPLSLSVGRIYPSPWKSAPCGRFGPSVRSMRSKRRETHLACTIALTHTWMTHAVCFQ